MKRLLILLLMFAGVARATVLTFTANNLTVHYGDDIPPLTWTNSGFAGTDTWSNAVTSGYPSCTTTYTSSSAVGTYPVTCSAGSLVATGSYTFSFVSGTITVEAATGMGAATVTVPLQPSGMMQNMTVANSSCSALVGDGVTDNTAAFNCFLNTGRETSCTTYGTRPKQFYLPSGVYLASGTLNFCGSAIAITGDGWNKSIVKLASASPGFSGTPLPFIYFLGGRANGANNNGFNEHFENIGVEVGPGNPSTSAVVFIGNNFNAVRNVKVWFDDSQGESAFNVDRTYPGQTLFKNIAGYGGSYCFKATDELEYNSVIYNLTCENQTTAGVITGGYNLESSNYFSVNSVPAWTNNSGAEVLLGAELIGGGSANTAITNGSNGTFYTRDVTPAGYLHTMTDSNGNTTNDGAITEHWSGTAGSLFPSGTPTGIIIPNPPDTPLASDPAPSTWCALGPDPTTWTGTLASCAATTAYVPVSCNYPGNTTDCSQIATQTGYYSPTTKGTINVTVPGNINHIMGNNYTTAGAVINWVIGGSSSNPPIILDHFNSTINQPNVSHASSRTLVFEDSGLSYKCSAGAGNVFFEDAQITVTSFCDGQSIYARGLDAESEGQILGVTSVGYVSATNTLTLTLAVDPGMTIGSYVYFVGISPATWLSSTPAVVTGISGSTVTATWYGTHADYPPTAQTAGNYRVQFDKVTGTGINLWALGWKSEKAGTDVNIVNGNVEIHGFFQYPLRSSPPGWAGFKFTDTNYFITGQSFFGGASQRPYFATETRSGVTLSLNNPAYGTSNSANLNMLYSTGSPSAAARPMFSPAAGTYPTTQTVTISTTTPSATIYYTTDGTTPSTNSTVYSSPITVSTTETVQAIATASGYSTSAVGSAAYTISSVAATPTFSPAGGTYSSAQMVTISTTTPSATIYYTTDGTTPTTSSTVYSGPVAVSASETVKAIATASGYTASAVGSAAYTIISGSSSSYPVTDAFSGSGALSVYWTNTTATGYVSLVQVSGTVVPSVSAKQGLAIYTGVAFTSDQYSQVKFVKNTSHTDSTGPCVRMNAAGNGVCWIADSGKIYVLRAGAGVQSVVNCALPASGDTLQLSVVGSTYTCTNVTTGVHASGTNTTYSVGNPGILVDQRPSTSYALEQFQGDCVPSCGAKPILTVTAASPTITYGQPLPAYTATYSGFVGGDSASILTGSPSFTTVPAIPNAAGSYPITVAAGTLSAPNYSLQFVNGTLTIQSAAVTVSLAANPSPAARGRTATLTATVTGPGQPGGPVVFTSGATTLCNAILNESGVATCSFVPAISGTVAITAQYGGDTNHFPGSAGLVLDVYDPAIALQFSSTELVYPGATNVTVCVTGNTPTGTVQIEDGATSLTTQPLQGNGCAYWYISPGLAAGVHTLTAVYSGDGNNAPGISARTAVDVRPVPVNMGVSCWNASFSYGTNYQCTVNVSSNAGSAQGSISYSYDGGPQVAVPLSNGNAGFTLIKPAAGNHSVVIAYPQQTNYGAAAQTETFTVTPAPIAVSLTPSSWYLTMGTSLTFSASVTSWSAGAPSGNGAISFYDGSTLLATVAVDSNGQASYTTSNLTAGSHTITATFGGGTNYASGSGSVTITIVP